MRAGDVGSRIHEPSSEGDDQWDDRREAERRQKDEAEGSDEAHSHLGGGYVEPLQLGHAQVVRGREEHRTGRKAGLVGDRE